MAKYIVSITTLNEEQLTADSISLPTLPDTLNRMTETLSPNKALDLEGLYLLSEAQSEELFAFLAEHHLPFPLEDTPTRLAKVVNIHDRRRRTQDPDHNGS